MPHWSAPLSFLTFKKQRMLGSAVLIIVIFLWLFHQLYAYLSKDPFSEWQLSILGLWLDSLCILDYQIHLKGIMGDSCLACTIWWCLTAPHYTQTVVQHTLGIISMPSCNFIFCVLSAILTLHSSRAIPSGLQKSSLVALLPADSQFLLGQLQLCLASGSSLCSICN